MKIEYQKKCGKDLFVLHETSSNLAGYTDYHPL